MPITKPIMSVLPGKNSGCNLGSLRAGTLFSPSIAEVTEIGGVMIPSASNVPAPIIAGMASHLP